MSDDYFHLLTRHGQQRHIGKRIACTVPDYRTQIIESTSSRSTTIAKTPVINHFDENFRKPVICVKRAVLRSEIAKYMSLNMTTRER